jgi:protein TonB
VLELAFPERAARGEEVVIPTPTGSTRLKIPRGTRVGGALRVPGEGLPARTRSGIGDLIVKLVPEGTPGAWTLAAPAAAPAAASVGADPHPVRPEVSKAAKVGLVVVLACAALVLLGWAGFEIASAAFAATTDQPNATETPASQPEPAAEEPAPPSESNAPESASGTAPAPRSPARIPSAPEVPAISLPGVDVATSFLDQPIASLSPVRPDASRAGSSGASLPAVTQAPRILNADRVQESLEREYPIGMRAARIGGRVEMRFDVDAQGRVERFQIVEGSGYSELDAAAQRVARVFQFSPALRGSERVATSVSFGITFGDGGARAGAAPLTRGTASAPNQPVPADFDVAPQVSNLPRVRQSLEREYPIGLRDTGVGGHVDMWFYVNEQGVVERFQIGQGSGQAALDQAALRVARVFQFTPARLGDQPVATWTSFRITFVGANPGGGEGARPVGDKGE